jgi:hypothetical protein
MKGAGAKIVILSPLTKWSKWERGGSGNTIGGKYHRTINPLFDWFILVCFANKN